MQLNHEAGEFLEPAYITSEQIVLAAFDIDFINERESSPGFHFGQDGGGVDHVDVFITTFGDAVRSI